jgi:hypothetical protein
MNESKISTDSEEVHKWVIYVAKRLANNVAEANIVNDLTRKGFGKEEAREFVRQVEILQLNAQTKLEVKKPSKKTSLLTLLIGIVLVILGVWSIISAIDNGGILWWGAIIVGFGLIGKGINGMRS